MPIVVNITTIEAYALNCFKNKDDKTTVLEVQNADISDGTEGVMVTSGSQVLMQTATAIVKSTSNDSSKSTRMILDSGSQRSYITENLAKDLNLKLRPPEKIAVATFGSDKPKYIKYKPTEL